MKIYIIEDDSIIANALKRALEKRDYEVVLAKDFHHISDEFTLIDPQLVLMDINLPSQNGYYWTSQIRTESNVPIIFISSIDETIDQLMAMQMGADDFITKPIDIDLTVAKIQALLRRTYDFSVATSTEHSLNYQDVSLNTGKLTLEVAGESVSLTFTELQLMTVLFRKNGDFASREELLDYCWKNDQFIDDNTLAVNITRLRKKCRELSLSNFIQTKKNVGYALNEGRVENG